MYPSCASTVTATSSGPVSSSSLWAFIIQMKKVWENVYFGGSKNKTTCLQLSALLIYPWSFWIQITISLRDLLSGKEIHTHTKNVSWRKSARRRLHTRTGTLSVADTYTENQYSLRMVDTLAHTQRNRKAPTNKLNRLVSLTHNYMHDGDKIIAEYNVLWSQYPAPKVSFQPR